MGRSADDQVSGRRKDAARRRFDRWAAGYERDRRSRFNARVQRDALAALELHSGDLLLDIGCGTGAAVRQDRLFQDVLSTRNGFFGERTQIPNEPPREHDKRTR